MTKGLSNCFFCKWLPGEDEIKLCLHPEFPWLDDVEDDGDNEERCNYGEMVDKEELELRIKKFYAKQQLQPTRAQLSIRLTRLMDMVKYVLDTTSKYSQKQRLDELNCIWSELNSLQQKEKDQSQ